MKNHLLQLVRNIQAEGHNIAEQPVLFKWDWADDLPGVEFQLLIKGSEDNPEQLSLDFEGNGTVH